MPLFYQPVNKKRKIYDLGVICHQNHHDLKVQNNNRVRYISINRTTDAEIESFVDEIVSCRQILTSSLHGLIIAQAYGIPVRHFFIKNLPIHHSQEFKFNDYMLGTEQKLIKPLLLKKDNLLDALALVSEIPQNVPDLKCVSKKLLMSFPKELLR